MGDRASKVNLNVEAAVSLSMRGAGSPTIYHNVAWAEPTDRSFRYASPCLWNQLPSSLRQPHFSPSVSVLPVRAPTTSHSVNSPLSPSIIPSFFHSWPNFTHDPRPTSFTNLSHHRLPSSPIRTDSTDLTTGPFFWASPFFLFLVSSLFFFVWFRAAD